MLTFTFLLGVLLSSGCYVDPLPYAGPWSETVLEREVFVFDAVCDTDLDCEEKFGREP